MIESQNDDYVLNTVVLAATLFLAGIALRFNWRPVRMTVTGLSERVCYVGRHAIDLGPRQ